MSNFSPQSREQSSILSRLREQLSAPPPSDTEESISLRVLVQVLVAIGILATDFAGDTNYSLWAIPISLIGAFWSWKQRHERNTTAKFLIAIGMLIALAVFFRNLVGSLNDTRLVLAELLIQLQVLHSFDLPRRKNLGYSMVIGLILLGAAGTLSQTIAFAPLLVVFLIIGLPVLVLDYRSRLGFDQSSETHSSQKKPLFSNSALPLRRLTLFFALILSLGLVIFAVMPRFPSYQIQNFPVSGAESLEDEGFDNNDREISSSGYVREGDSDDDDGEGSGNGEGSPVEGAGEMSQDFYYGFSNQINQNLRGELNPRVVMRLRSQADGWIKMLAFDHYTGEGWKIEEEEPTREIDRPSWSYRFRLSTPSTQAQTERVVQTYTVTNQLPNLIPALPNASEVYFPTREIAVDPHGSLQSPVPLGEGLTYTVVSRVPYRDRAQLRQAGDNYPESIRETYLQVPSEIEDRIREHGESLLAESSQPLDATYEKVLYLAQTLKQGYQLQPDIPFLEDDQDLVETFLFDWEGGYPDHFSSTLTIMLRSLGIPARLATGFSTGEFNPFTGLYVIRNTDAFALTEVYFPNYGWLPFNPIPGYEVIPPSVEQSETFGVLRQIWNWVAGWLPTPVAGFLNYLWTLIIGSITSFFRALWGFITQGWVGAITGLIGLFVASFLSWLGWKQLQRWRYQRWLSQLPPVAGLYQQMLQALEQANVSKQPGQTPFEYLQTATVQLENAQAELVEEISQAYVSWRYGGYEVNLDYLRNRLKQLKRSLKRLS
ncbi:DUF3488 domain-containing protein [Euhalothece natronophila Z-M001]|uniref:DUF3488 domain-containing protein n=1 Tax=Euhalothece natronophila Z-M001 TaxID=522448 RepID=A0A5B8NQC0_9CHRO|nr:DUF3488 and DUF4129 domain-containing transglutaminase family protein [Euhalothece natronophila]QDZ41178.1 DUF3488 domain-containing protein [Euhalothece natronophila Z-M001]